jgi:hypothetical protein
MEKYEGFSGGCVQLPVCDKTALSEMSADFTLPDYQPEIKRLLRVSASVLPPSKYIGDRECSLAGNIDYFVLYTASDNEVYCAPLTGEYKIGIPIDGAEGEDGGYLSGAVCSATVSPDMISGRVTAPRKISVKSRLRSRVQVFCEAEMSNDDLRIGEDVQILKACGKVARVLHGISEQISLSDEMICHSRDGDVRVINADGRVFLDEVVASQGGVVCRGDVYLKLLLCLDDGGLPYTVQRKIPISATVRIDGAKNGDSAFASGCITDMNIAVEDGRIAIDLGALLECEVCSEESVEYIKDVFSTERKTENEYKTVTFPAEASAFSGNFTLSDSRSLDETGIAQGTHVLDVWGTAYPEEYLFEGGRCAINGKARFSLILEKDGEFSANEIELPFSYKTSVNGDFDRAICRAEVISTRSRVDGDRIGIDAEIAIGGRAAMGRGEKLLSRVGFGDSIERARGEFVVCYPSEDDTLWSVSKRYGASVSEVAEANGLDRERDADSHGSIEGLNYLII